jgi:hypothetical protein
VEPHAYQRYFNVCERKALIDLEQLQDVFRDLERLVESEPALSPFRSNARQLREAAEGLATGRFDVPALAEGRCPSVPTRELATRILRILEPLPCLDGDEPMSLARGVGRLLGNLVNGVTHDLYANYEDLIPTRN